MRLRNPLLFGSLAFAISFATAPLVRSQSAAAPTAMAPTGVAAEPTDSGNTSAARPDITPDAAPPAAGASSPKQSASAPFPSSAGTPKPAPRALTRTCVEHLPDGKARPEVSERFPQRGYSGHAAVLEVHIKHGRGERVLPGALEVQTDSDAAKALARSGFVLPDPKGPGRPRVQRRDDESVTLSVVRIPLVPLPQEPGRHELVLPPLPIAMARASGEVVTLCTSTHAIQVEDPIANQPHAEPKPNPRPRRQRELWEALRNAAYGGLAGLALALALALAYRWWRRRPRPIPPPPPPRPPWEVALEALHDIRHARLVEQGRLDSHLERVTNALRAYLGARYGFDGLECTTDEILSTLAEHPDAVPILGRAQTLLREADLVKFADVEPLAEQCEQALEIAEHLVRETTPSSESLSAPDSPSGKRAS